MSRSYRAPIYVDGFKGSKRKQFAKRYANRCVRNAVDVPDGKAYRKFYDSWDICDYKFWYDPEPRIYFINGTPRIIEPSPIWRVARK